MQMNIHEFYHTVRTNCVLVDQIGHGLYFN